MTVLSETIAAEADLLESVLTVPVDDAAERIGRSKRLWLVGTGTSQHAAELGALMFGPGKRDARWRSSAAFCGDPPALRADDAVVIVSHTTETAFARRARAHAIERGSGVVSITAQGRGWPEAVEAAPLERAETYTASYLAALVVLARLSVAVGGEFAGGGMLPSTSAGSNPPTAELCWKQTCVAVCPASMAARL